MHVYIIKYLMLYTGLAEVGVFGFKPFDNCMGFLGVFHFCFHYYFWVLIYN